MDDNLAELLAYADAKARGRETKVQEFKSIHTTHAASAKDCLQRNRKAEATWSLLAGKHHDSTPTLFSALPRPGQGGFDMDFECAGRAPQKNETWDNNFEQLFAYAVTKTVSDLPEVVDTLQEQPNNPCEEDAQDRGTEEENFPAVVDAQEQPNTPCEENAHDPDTEEESQPPASCPFPAKGQASASNDVSRRSSAATHEGVAVNRESPTSVHEDSQDEKKEPVRPKGKQRYAGGCTLGWSTEEIRQFWFEQKNRTGNQRNKASTEKGMSLDASTDPNDPIYYWQLYSVLGPDRIKNLVHRFYSNIYSDTEESILRNVFEKLPMEQHVRQQASFWIDAFGGGRQYAGGWERVEFHHKYGAAEIMTVKGATRWAYHMNRAIAVADLTDDPRVKTCLCEFLKIHMDKYGQTFKFDTSNIKFGDTGLKGAMKSFNSAVTKASGGLMGSFGLFSSKSKDKKTGKEAQKAKGGWAVLRAAAKPTTAVPARKKEFWEM